MERVAHGHRLDQRLTAWSNASSRAAPIRCSARRVWSPTYVDYRTGRRQVPDALRQSARAPGARRCGGGGGAERAGRFQVPSRCDGERARRPEKIADGVCSSAAARTTASPSRRGRCRPGRGAAQRSAHRPGDRAGGAARTGRADRADRQGTPSSIIRAASRGGFPGATIVTHADNVPYFERGPRRPARSAPTVSPPPQSQFPGGQRQARVRQLHAHDRDRSHRAQRARRHAASWLSLPKERLFIEANARTPGGRRTPRRPPCRTRPSEPDRDMSPGPDGRSHRADPRRFVPLPELNTAASRAIPPEP